MKVFDLHCSQEHVFEGWFASQQDFADQMARGLVECPVCGCKQLRKGLSAPRLNLGAAEPVPLSPTVGQSVEGAAPAFPGSEQTRKQWRALQAAWLTASRKIVASTEDVGAQFADEALRMHKGEEPLRPIRGQATPQQAHTLLEEGVPLMPLLLPKSSKETLQ